MAGASPKKSSKTPEEWQLMLQQAREISKQRREANRMPPEEFAAFKAWNREIGKQMFPGNRHLILVLPEEDAKSSTEAP